MGGHDWTVTYPQSHIARERRLPVMTATTTKNLKYWQPIFGDNITSMIRNLGVSHGTKSEDIVHHLRINTLRNSQVVMGSSGPSSTTASSPTSSVSAIYSLSGACIYQSGHSAG